MDSPQLHFAEIAFEAVVGVGLFGRVWKADYLGTDVAVKECKAHKGVDSEKYNRREVEILQRARHPNVVQFIDYCIHDGVQYIVSEFVPGGSLRDLIKDGQREMPWRQRISFAIDIARALAFLHSRNVIHRDVKSENCLITENNRVKVCDFGFSRIAARNEDESRRLTYCGTDGYLSPEVMLGMPFTAAIDTFSFGIVLCDLICRRLADEDEGWLPRVVPGLGVNPQAARQHAQEGCPELFLDVAILCADSDPRLRPQWKETLRLLRLAEASVPDVEHVGTIADAHAESPINGSVSAVTSPTILNMFEVDSPNEQPFRDRYGFHLSQTTRSELDWIVEPQQSASTIMADDEATESPVTDGEASDGSNVQAARIHRFSLVKIKSKAMCGVCGNRVGGIFSGKKKTMECDDCGEVCHMKCSAAVGSSCRPRTAIRTVTT